MLTPALLYGDALELQRGDWRDDDVYRCRNRTVAIVQLVVAARQNHIRIICRQPWCVFRHYDEISPTKFSADWKHGLPGISLSRKLSDVPPTGVALPRTHIHNACKFSRPAPFRATPDERNKRLEFGYLFSPRDLK